MKVWVLFGGGNTIDTMFYNVTESDRHRWLVRPDDATQGTLDQGRLYAYLEECLYGLPPYEHNGN